MAGRADRGDRPRRGAARSRASSSRRRPRTPSSRSRTSGCGPRTNRRRASCASRAPGSWPPRTRERRRIERDLHDGAQQRLVALRIRLELARGAGATDDPERGAGCSRARRRHRGGARRAPRARPRHLPAAARRPRARRGAARGRARAAPVAAHGRAATAIGRYPPEIEARSTSAAWRRSRTPTSTPGGARARSSRLADDGEPALRGARRRRRLRRRRSVAAARASRTCATALGAIGGRARDRRSRPGGGTVRRRAAIPLLG